MNTLLELVNKPTVLSALVLLLPAWGVGVAWLLYRPTYFQAVGLMLGVLLNIPYLFLFNHFADTFGWWHFTASLNSYLNMPLELILGWAIFWGALLPYALRSFHWVYVIAVAVLLDLWLMPRLGVLFQLGDKWLVGEAVLICGCLLPSIIVFQLTQTRRCILLRALLQSYIWGGWVVFLIPSVILNLEGKLIFDIWALPLSELIIFIVGLICSALMGYLAVFELARRGRGTPIPFDPPKKLVVTGIYAYVANPLQMSTLLIFISVALAYRSELMLAAIASLIIYCEAFVRWHHTVDIEQRFGDRWLSYRKNVHNWWPRLRPYKPESLTRALAAKGFK